VIVRAHLVVRLRIPATATSTKKRGMPQGRAP
jgi:hypothetical protein